MNKVDSFRWKTTEINDLLLIPSFATLDISRREVHYMPKIGRNDQCPCGSGKKYKKCCMGKGVIVERQTKMAESAVSFPGITPVQLIPSSSSKESALYDAFDEIVELDCRYLDQWRFSDDLMILLKTIWVVLRRKGAI